MKQEFCLRIEHISKSFGVVEALKDVSFSASRGTIHTILGENGAGKSTLMRVISGEVKPDAGAVYLDGKSTFELGDQIFKIVKMVHQELYIFDNLSVAENIFPDFTFKRRLGLIDRKRLYENTEQQIRLFGIDIKPSEKLINLSLAEQQIVEILRAISSKPEVIILDEPTSSLSSRDAKILQSLLLKLKKQNITIIYISHRIKEVLEISDRITVLKDGRYVDTLENENISEEQLISLMVSREVSTFYSLMHKRKPSEGRKDYILRVEDLYRARVIHNVSFEVVQNEILGFFGLEGSGTNELSKVIFGLESVDAGVFWVNEEKHLKISPQKMMQRGFIYLSKDRKKEGLFLDLSASDNVVCPSLEKVATLNWIDSRKVAKFAISFINKFNIIIPSMNTLTKKLSGGNQQKLMVSTCIGTEPKCIILNEPTRGIDVGIKSEIYRYIEDFSRSSTIVIFSSELPELISLCDRIIVMKDRRISGQVLRQSFSEESIMALAAGKG